MDFDEMQDRIAADNMLRRLGKMVLECANVNGSFVMTVKTEYCNHCTKPHITLDKIGFLEANNEVYNFIAPADAADITLEDVVSLWEQAAEEHEGHHHE